MLNGSKKIIKIGFLKHLTTQWMGGINYYKTLFMAIKYINESNTDDIILEPYIFKPKESEVANDISNYAKFIDIKEIKTLKYYFKKFYKKIFNKEFKANKYIKQEMSPKFDVTSHAQTILGVPALVWIPDFQHLHLPEMFSEKEIENRNVEFMNKIKTSKFVILSSEDALNDLRNFAPNYVHKARVLHFVPYINPNMYSKTDELKSEIILKHQLPEKYFYVPNQFWKHKNHKVIFEAISELKKQNVNINVVFTGSVSDYRNKSYFDELMNFAASQNIMDNIKILGLVDLTEVHYLIRNCISVINPSLFEGWSTTVEECKSIGKNIILSDLNVHKEQNPPQGIYFNPHNPSELAEILKNKWNSGNFGPDYELERLAKESMNERMKEFGRQYKSIVLETLN